MASIAYVDHSFHRTTKSTGFLADLMRRHGHVVQNFWDDAWQGGAAVSWTEVTGHDVVLMFQSYCTPQAKHFRLQHPNVIYVPMLDQFGIWQGPLFNLTEFWEPFQGSKVINFSLAAHAITTGFGIASHFTRYQPPIPEYQEVPRAGLHGFFWLRRERELPWQVIRQLIANSRFDSLHIHLATDPGSPPPTLPSQEDVEWHRITTSTWFENKSDLERVMARANVYFAPRLEEGIGQSFLEAMSRGQCVVAPDHGTMNEYIVSGVNGLLYDPRAPLPLDLSRVVQLGTQARTGAEHGREAWVRGERDLLAFVLTPSEEFYAGRYRHPSLQVESQPTIGSTVSELEARKRGLWEQLRIASKRYALMKTTRFVWLPVKKLIEKACRVDRT